MKNTGNIILPVIKIALLTGFFLVISCQSVTQRLIGISEGVITYKVGFPDLDPTSLAANMLPSEIKQFFKGNKIRVEFNIGPGIMKSTYISDSKKKSIAILLDMFGKKYATNNTPENIRAERQKMPKFIMEPVDETLEIAGYTCKKVIIRDSLTQEQDYIYYTNQIRAHDINWHTPFTDINGVMLKYQIEYHLAHHTIFMELEASKVQQLEINDKLFRIPKDYQIVPKEKIDEMLDDLMSMSL